MYTYTQTCTCLHGLRAEGIPKALDEVVANSLSGCKRKMVECIPGLADSTRWYVLPLITMVKAPHP